MTSFPILDLIAGMIFIYFLMSIICNAIFEGFSALRRLRAGMLEKWLKSNLPNVAGYFLDHTMINGLSAKGKSTAYISPGNFSLVLLDAIVKETGTIPSSLADLAKMLDELALKNKDLLPEELQRSLKLFIVEAQQASLKAGQMKTEFELYHALVETWFDSQMERVGGVYKRYASYATFIIALAATFILNVDSISIAKYLYSNKDAREALAEVAYKAPSDTVYKAQVNRIKTQDSTVTKTKDGLGTIITIVKNNIITIDSNKSKIATLIPIGWNTEAEYKVFMAEHHQKPHDDKDKHNDNNLGIIMLFVVLKFFGLLVTVFAVCLGAPFWYDVLGKVANLRNTIKPSGDDKKSKK